MISKHIFAFLPVSLGVLIFEEMDLHIVFLIPSCLGPVHLWREK